jgi:hypothetical protein
VIGRFNPTSPPRAPAPPATDGPGGASSLVEAVLSGVMYREVTVPRTEVAGKMRLLRRSEETEVRMAVRRELAERFGLQDGGPGILEAYAEWREAWRLHFLARAIRDPRDPERPLATVDEWATCDDVQLLALWSLYQDLEAELDPFGPTAPPLTEEEAGAIRAAAKKGDLDLLTSFGSRRLALFTRSSVATPAT